MHAFCMQEKQDLGEQEAEYYRLNCIPLNSCVEELTLNMIAFRDGAFVKY